MPTLAFDANNFSLWASGEWWMLLAAQSMAIGTIMVRWVSKYSDPVMATGWVRCTFLYDYQHQIPTSIVLQKELLLLYFVTCDPLEVCKDHCHRLHYITNERVIESSRLLPEMSTKSLAGIFTVCKIYRSTHTHPITVVDYACHHVSRTLEDLSGQSFG